MIFINSGIVKAEYLLVDQANMADVDSFHSLSYFKFDQEFRPSFSSMDTVGLAIYTNEGATLQVNIREAAVDGPIVGMSEELYLFPASTGMADFIFTSPVPLVPGNSYTMDLRLLDGSASIASSFEGGGYTAGYMFIDGINTPTDNSDIIFRTGLAQADLIDIIKGSDKLCLNTNSAYTLIIAILSSDIFDATTVNPETVSFAGAGVKKLGKNGQYLCRQEDTNNDGLLDLSCRIDSTRLVIEEGVSAVIVKADTFDGKTIIGEETICQP
jgi:archaellum component FlaF (FlaF/FlaG flagellin family)